MSDRDSRTGATSTSPATSETDDWEEVEETEGPDEDLESKDVLAGEFSREFKEEKPEGVEALNTDFRPRSRIGILIVIFTFLGFGGWAFFAHVDGAAIAMGEVMVDSQNRVVQHLEGGVISEILVEDGDKVDKGEALIRLSDTRAKSELQIVESQLFEVLGLEARLLAERAGADEVRFPEELTSRAEMPSIKAILDGQRELFRARTESLEANIDIHEQRIESLGEQIQGMASLSDNLSGRIASYENEVRQWQELYERQLADRIRINEMERELLRLRGEKDSTDSEIARTKVEISSTRSELLLTRQEYMEQVATNLREVQQKRADLSARRVSLLDTLERLAIRSPAEGTVVGLKVHTEGAVIKPGDTIMEVVPGDQQFAVKARVDTVDIDRVEIGQLADIRLSAFNFQAAHVIEAQVMRISADAFHDEKSGKSYYEARLRVTGEGKSTMAEQNMYFVPGMPAEVMIRTGERTVLQYLLDPFIRLSERAFREA